MQAISPTTPLTTPQLLRRLAKRYPANTHAFLTEVRHPGGPQGTGRSADALAMGLWQTRGMELEGFELKISRSDWRHELMAPEKAESWGSVCDRWWLVVSDEDIVQQGELPSTWGLMAAEETGLKVVRPAPKLEPSVLSRTHLAGMMASALGYRLAEQRYYYSCGMDRGRRRAEEDVDRLEEEVRQLRRAIADFEEASGLSIAGRGIVPAVVGRIVRAVLDGKAEGLRLNQIKGYRTRALGIVERLVKDLDELVELEELVAGAIRQNKRDQDSGGDPLGS